MRRDSLEEMEPVLRTTFRRSGAIARWPRLASVLAVLALLAFASARARDARQVQPPPFNGDLRTGGMVWITVEGDLLFLDEEVPVPPEEGIPVPPALEGLLGFSAASPLPDWAIRAQFEPTAGPGGPVDVDLVVVRSPATSGEFISIAGCPVVAVGHGPEPAPNLWLKLQVRPEWTDEPGAYEGFLHLIPVGPTGYEGSEGEWADESWDVPGDDGDDGSYGPRVTIPVELEVGSLTMVMTSQSEYSIHTDAGSGRYDVEPDLNVLVASNEGQWELRAEGTPFVSRDDEIPFERLEWSRLDSDGEPGPWTLLGVSNCLMSGYDERGVFPAVFRLVLEVTATDVAGNYICEIHLVGSPG